MTEYENIISKIKEGAKREVIERVEFKEKWDKFKKDSILEAKNVLIKNNHKPESISAKITADLKGYVEKSYVRKILDAEFKREYKKMPAIMTTDGTTTVQESGEKGGGGDNDDPPKHVSAADITRARINKLAQKAGGSVTRSINTSQGRSLPDRNEDSDNVEEEELTHEPELTTVVLGPVHFNTIREWLNSDSKIYMDFNPDTMMITKVYIKEQDE